MNISTPQLVLWIALMAGECAVLASIAYSRQWRQFPHFALYISFCLLRSVTLFVVVGTCDSAVYAWAYFVGMAMQSVLVLALIHELLKSLFASKRNVPKFGCSFAALALVCVAASFLANHDSYGGWAFWMFRTFDRAVSWFVLAALVRVIWTSRYYGKPWKRRAFRIALGLLIAISSYVVFASLAPYLSTSCLSLAYVNMGGFLIAEVIWMFAYMRPDTKSFVISADDLRRLNPSTLYKAVNTTSCDLTCDSLRAETYRLEQKAKLGA